MPSIYLGSCWFARVCGELALESLKPARTVPKPSLVSLEQPVLEASSGQ
jgi:hypothetical protein